MADNMAGTPRPSRFAGVQNNVRAFLRDIPTPSSLYSRSPNPTAKSEESPAPRIPSFQGFLRRSREGRGSLLGIDFSGAHLPLYAEGTNAAAYSPATQPSEWGRHPLDPSPVILPDHDRVEQEQTAIHQRADIEEHGRERRRRKHRRRRRHQHGGAWVRKRGKKRQGVCFPLFHGPLRTTFLSCIISGLFLGTVLAIYLSLAFAMGGLRQEVHILFILTILATTIFFVHSLTRILVSVLRPRQPVRTIPSITGPEGFRPTFPIRVHLARDEEIAAQGEDGIIEESKMEALKVPPPAYGLWRCSVRVNPNLLYWQRVEAQQHHNDGNRAAATRLEHVAEHPAPAADHVRSGPRPPSYASEDGVEYVVAAQPRSTVYMPQPTNDIHPAYR